MTTRLTSRMRTSVIAAGVGQEGSPSEDGISGVSLSARSTPTTSGKAEHRCLEDRVEQAGRPASSMTARDPIRAKASDERRCRQGEKSPCRSTTLAADPEEGEWEEARLEQGERRSTAPGCRNAHRRDAPDDGVARPDLERGRRPGETQRDERPDRGPWSHPGDRHDRECGRDPPPQEQAPGRGRTAAGTKSHSPTGG